MKLIDDRPANKMVPFKDLPVGTVFEHLGMRMIFLKIETFKYNCDKDSRIPITDGFKNAVRLDNYDGGFGESWFIAPEGSVHPLNDVEIIIKD